MYLQSLIVTTLAALVVAAPTSNHVVHETRSLAASNWHKRELVPRGNSLPMRIGLKQSNLDQGHGLLMEVSDPDSPKYGKYYSAEEVADLFAPSTGTVEGVREWLEQAGISRGRVSQSTNKAWLQFDAPVEEAEALLKTRYHYFEHGVSGDANIAADEYSVPGHIVAHIDYITPGVRLLQTGRGERKQNLDKRADSPTYGHGAIAPKVLKPLPAGLPPLNSFATNAEPTYCDKILSPACIRLMYQIPLGSKSDPSNRLGIYASEDLYSQDDLDTFFGFAASEIPLGTGPVQNSIDGGNVTSPSPEESGSEAPLDLMCAYPIIYPQGAVMYAVDDLNIQTESEQVNRTFKLGLFNTFLDALDGSYCTFSYDGETGDDPAYDFTYPDNGPGGYNGSLQCGVYKPTNVISISYSLTESQFPIAYQERQCQEWMKLGLQGVSVVFSSGDQGVGGKSGVNGCLGDGTIFSPQYPITCPYLTTVGATTLPTGGNPEANDEVAAELSSGGFSNIYETPEWQKSAVSTYFSNAGPTVAAYPYYTTSGNVSVGANGGIYNRGGRGIPDVSAAGENILVVSGGNPFLQAGTSASTPIIASILTRINEERLAAGKSTIGFVNPTLYKNPTAFNDITSGNNPGCRSHGFDAVQGWDPVTGLGTPIYPKLLQVFMNLP